MDSRKVESRAKCPRQNVNPLNYLFFAWTIPIMMKGRKKELDVNDLYEPLKSHTSDIIGTKLCNAWEAELKLAKKKNRKPSLLRAGLKVFGWQIMGLGLLLVLADVFRILQPVFLGKLIDYYAQDTNGLTKEIYLYSAGIILCSILIVMIMHPFMFEILHMGMKLRVAACSLIYRKALKLNKTALGDATAGQIVNLLSNDVGRLDLSIIFLHYLWVGPVEVVIVTYLLYREIGSAAFVGVAFLLIFIPLQIYLGKKTSVWRLKTALRTDERVRVMSEIIQGIQVIKMYAWEKPFAKLVKHVRNREIKIIRYTSYIRGLMVSFIMFITRVSIFSSLVVYALLDNVVTAEKAFVITSYYNILRVSMSVFFPQGIGQFAETLVSISRVEKYMLYKEFLDVESPATKSAKTKDVSKKQEEEMEKIRKTDVNVKTTATPSVKLTSVNAKWVDANPELTLNDINLNVTSPSLTAIIGPIGSGKSSIFQVLLGELPIKSGTVSINGTISFASQEPWLFSSSIRQNILFGLPMDKERYKRVVHKCALERDFALFPHGDHTMVGERGAALSGGQKARVSLARAVYREADIYILDDPLSAVDSHVGKHLFEKCMRGFLRDKIVILITHQLQFLQDVDLIVLLDHGKVLDVGPYDHHRASGLDFALLLAARNKEEEEEKHKVLGVESSMVFKRQNSDLSTVSNELVTSISNMQVTEKSAGGKIGLSLYQKYFTIGGGALGFILLIIVCVFAQVSASASDYFVNYWVKTTAECENDAVKALNDTVSNDTLRFERSIVADLFNVARDGDTSYCDVDYTHIYIFTGLIVATITLTLSRIFVFYNMALTASRRLHDKMFVGISHATMYFFNTNPTGRILNRFSKDMGQVDEILPTIMIDLIQIFLTLFGIVIVISIVNFWYIIPTVALLILFYYMRSFYLQSSRNIKRTEAITRSPVYSHLAATLDGLATIRAFEAEKELTKEFDRHQDLNSSAYYVFLGTNRAFGFYLDVSCVMYIIVVVVAFFFGNNSGGNVGLAITQALGMTGMVQWGMRQSAEVENTMTSVERVMEYQHIDPEPSLESPEDKKPPKDWPEEGRITFKNLSLRYAPDEKSSRVLKNLDFEILPKEKIGIVGRTGAGKSSTINALFRLCYTEGSIIIDGRDILNMGLHDLRSKISIIPQEPVLFSGTMRYNLDPFDEFSDEKIWNSLSEVKLKDAIKELPGGLSSKMTEGGSNFSVGQRQLVCLARAILRENRILVMDEATANVDVQTDFLIQETIRRKFADCTVLTIAHRLQTIMDSDKVIVMDSGYCIEFGSPYELLTTQIGPRTFYGMVQSIGKSKFDELFEIAKAAHFAKKKNE